MAKKGLLVVSFGTSYPDAMERDIVPVEKAIAAAFPDYAAWRAFSGGMIIRKLKTRDGIQIDTVSEALEKMTQAGIEEVLVQPTFLIPGIEYDGMMAAIQKARERFRCIRVGRPLLSRTEDLLALADRIAEKFPKENGTLVLMGHGTEHYANAMYPALETIFRKRGHFHVFVGAVEGYPDIDLVCRELMKAPSDRAILTPLMLVAGDHATNDMASDEPDSWKSKLQKVGVTPTCVIRGLGSYPFVQTMFVNHARKAEPV